MGGGVLYGWPTSSLPCLVALRNFSVEMYFRNESANAPWPVPLPDCPHRCPLQDFLRLTEPVVPKDWQQECQLASGPTDTGEPTPAWATLIPSQCLGRGGPRVSSLTWRPPYAFPTVNPKALYKEIRASGDIC